jgi:hypothetical protein
MPVFQLGVDVLARYYTTILVRVEAEDIEEAKTLSMRAVEAEASKGTTLNDLVEMSYVYLEPGGIEVEGIGRDDYSDMSPKGYPEADIDLTQNVQVSK